MKEIRAAKTKIEFAAEIGGHLGLLVGVSFLTVVEVLELLCQLCHLACRKKRNVVENA